MRDVLEPYAVELARWRRDGIDFQRRAYADGTTATFFGKTEHEDWAGVIDARFNRERISGEPAWSHEREGGTWKEVQRPGDVVFVSGGGVQMIDAVNTVLAERRMAEQVVRARKDAEQARKDAEQARKDAQALRATLADAKAVIRDQEAALVVARDQRDAVRSTLRSTVWVDARTVALEALHRTALQARARAVLDA